MHRIYSSQHNFHPFWEIQIWGRIFLTSVEKKMFKLNPSTFGHLWWGIRWQITPCAWWYHHIYPNLFISWHQTLWDKCRAAAFGQCCYCMCFIILASSLLVTDVTAFTFPRAFYLLLSQNILFFPFKYARLYRVVTILSLIGTETVCSNKVCNFVPWKTK